MKINKEELRSVKSKIPDISEILQNGINDLKHCQKIPDVKVYVASIWDRWLTRSEFDELFYASKEEEITRRKKFIRLYSALSKHHSETYTWKLNRRKGKKEIRKLSAYKKSEYLRKTKAYRTGNVYGTFELILPELSLVAEMSCDWCCTLICNDQSKTKELTNMVKDAGLYLFEY